MDIDPISKEWNKNHLTISLSILQSIFKVLGKEFKVLEGNNSLF